MKGATCYKGIRTLLDGTACETFQQACVALGLLTDDREWITALNEANYVLRPSQIRAFFTVILVFSNPSDPLALWTQFQNAL